MVEKYFRLRCEDSDRYLCVSGEGELDLCADKNRAEQFSEDLIEFTLPVAEVQFDAEFRLLRVPDEELDLQRMQGVINH
jgi:hypothetical protein